MMGGPQPYSSLAESLPRLSDKVLSDRLHELAAAGLVEREVTNGFPRRTEYRLTARGQQLRPLLIELYRTGLALQGRAGDSEFSRDHRQVSRRS